MNDDGMALQIRRILLGHSPNHLFYPTQAFCPLGKGERGGALGCLRPNRPFPHQPPPVGQVGKTPNGASHPLTLGFWPPGPKTPRERVPGPAGSHAPPTTGGLGGEGAIRPPQQNIPPPTTRPPVTPVAIYAEPAPPFLLSDTIFQRTRLKRHAFGKGVPVHLKN